ncbi:MAG TPA: hypothetical protein VN937_18390 [Blastocatellia bacterium]|nr:hypothetical protein [Blastocatellia bacterium]
MFNTDDRGSPQGRPQERGSYDERLFSGRRVRNLIFGTLIAVVGGLVAVNVFMYLQYGGTMFDRYFARKEPKSPMAGKLAFDKGTKYYIGIIRAEGRSQRQGNVYYIEQAGGMMIEVAKVNVEVRDPEKSDK